MTLHSASIYARLDYMGFQKNHKDFRTPLGLAAMAQKLSQKRVGPGNPMYKKRPHNFKGRTLSTDGYWLIAVDGKRVREHRIVAEKMLGRKLEKHEIVHHVDGDKLNNRPENLMVLQSNTEHRAIHASKGGGAYD